MSDNLWQDGEDDLYESNAMRVLREKAERDSQVIREMAERLQKMEEKENRRALEDSLKAKGLAPEVADLIPKGSNPDEWLTKYGALLKTEQPAADDSTGDDAGADDGVPADEADALGAMTAAAGGAVPKAGLDSVAAKIQNAESAEDLLKILQSNG